MNTPAFLHDEIVVRDHSDSRHVQDRYISDNVEFLDSLSGKLVYPEEICADAWQSYSVSAMDYDMSSFGEQSGLVYFRRTHWHPVTIDPVRGGLQAMGAKGHVELLDQFGELFLNLSEDDRKRYLDSNQRYADDDPVIKRSSELTRAWSDMYEKESLERLNGDWLLQHPKLKIVEDDDWENEIKKVVARIPDRDYRLEKRRAARPRSAKLTEVLLKQAGITEYAWAGCYFDEYDFRGNICKAWTIHVIGGTELMQLEHDGKAWLFKSDCYQIVDEDKDLLVCIPAGPEYDPVVI